MGMIQVWFETRYNTAETVTTRKVDNSSYHRHQRETSAEMAIRSSNIASRAWNIPDMKSIRQIITDRSRPLERIPTELLPRLPKLNGIRAVVFDIYGTLLISGSGDIGSADDESHQTAFREAFKAVGIRDDCDITAVERRYRQSIADSHAAAKANGIEYPEVEIRDIWKNTLDSLINESIIQPLEFDDRSLAELAIEYEVRANPAWPMPNCRETLETLRDVNIQLGIISNAQYFTPDLFPSLLGVNFDELGFHKALRFYSYEYSQAKPGLFLYEQCRQKLEGLGIQPEQALYVGNDMLKDIWPAQQVGFRTALFAGDARSLRLRTDDDRVQNVTPDTVVTDLAQIPLIVAAE